MKIIKMFFQIFLLLCWNPFFLMAIIIVATPIVIKLVRFKIDEKKYKESSYYKTTRRSYSSVINDAGQYGEYLTYKYLQHFETNGAKFLFNVYIPKGNGETTEIDVLMICTKGIFVFESKNYSGWIFGSENRKYWYQTLRSGRKKSLKETFYNPVMQNRSHIKHLNDFLDEHIPMYSVIVFSERCVLMNVQIQSSDIHVIKRYDVDSVVSSICDQSSNDVLNVDAISELYNKLYKYTQIDENEKTQHIANIQANLNTTYATPKEPTEITWESEAIQHELAEKSDILQVVTEHQECSTPQKAEHSHSVEIENSKGIPHEVQVNKCPQCNGNLVIRTASRGKNVGKQFYGCSNYPKCKYILNIDKTPTD